MPEMRKDPVIGRWVIVAKSRANRPHDFEAAPSRRKGKAFCPFCVGNESHTPEEVYAVREHSSVADTPGWSLRVVPNKFPALQVEGQLDSRGDGIYDLMRGIGAHEVIIESPRHVLNSTDLNRKEMANVYWAYRERLCDLKCDSRLSYGMIFKNVGVAAGASLEHAHSQLIATSLVPVVVADEMEGAKRHFNARGRCIYCDMIRQELQIGSRIVYDGPDYIAFCPFASRMPFETWILPKHHWSHYEEIDRPATESLAVVAHSVLSKVETVLDRSAYNYMIHTAPFKQPTLGYYHWHIEIVPRITNVAGFEWGTGFYINPVPPEEAASFLREVDTERLRPQTATKSEAGKNGKNRADYQNMRPCFRNDTATRA